VHALAAPFFPTDYCCAARIPYSPTCHPCGFGEADLKKLVALFSVLLVATLMACKPKSPLTDSPLVPLSPLSTATPATSLAPTVAPTRSPSTGVVTGRLVVQTSLTPKPDVSLFLAEVIESSQDDFAVAALDEQNSPSAPTDTSGQFTFVNIEPGDYGLILQSPLETVLLKNIYTGKDIIVSVVADQTVDLGTIEVLPGY